MNEIKYQDVVKTALSEVGYQGETKNSKYTQFLDSINWYNYKKAGACTWCAIFYDYCIAVNKGDLTYEQARIIDCEPANHANNSGAGCTQKAQMYKDKGRWISSVSKATTGDQIFFKKSNGQIYHSGILVDWDNNGIYTVEGSTDGAKVSKRYYAFNDSKTPFIVAMSSIALKAFLNWLLILKLNMGIAGITLSTSFVTLI